MNDKFNVNPQLVEEQFKKNDEVKQSRKVVFDAKNYLNLRLNPGEKTKQIKVRLLPVSEDNQNLFMVLNVHSLKVNTEIAQSGFKSFICLNDENLEHQYECPLCKKSNELLAAARRCKDPVESKALYKQAMQYHPKNTYVIRVIERGKEDEGVKFWRFNKHSDGRGIWDMLANLYNLRNRESIEANGKEYNIFDIYNGKDIVITLSIDPNTGRTSQAISDAGFSTPLSDDIELVKKWVCDEKKWSDMYAFKTPDYLQIIADGGIPYYDKVNSCWVPKTKNEEENVANDILEYKEEETKTSTIEEDGDLPF